MMRPMLGTNADEKNLRFPLIASPKLDGIRGLVNDGMLLSRTLKLIPNNFIQGLLGLDMLNGFDGELIIGPPNAEDVYRKSVSGIMGREGVPECTYWVFDLHDCPEAPYGARYEALEKRVNKLPDRLKERVRILDQVVVNNQDELAEFEAATVGGGFEGVIVRDPGGGYKYGRSTEKEGLLLKIKRFTDGEAEIIGFEEQMHNANEAQTNELGRTKRSTAKAGLEATGVLGALIVKDVKSGVEFKIGTGLDAQTRRDMWQGQSLLMGRIAKYKSFPIGVLDKPRHPVWQGLRDVRDM